MEQRKNLCLWCNTELENGLFCPSGGKTLAVSNTGERKITKSYCYSDFLGMLRMTTKCGLALTKEEKDFLLYKDEIKEWYKGIPMVFETVEEAELEIKKCSKCNNPMEDTIGIKYGRFTDNEHPSSPKLWLCNCGKHTEAEE